MKMKNIRKHVKEVKITLKFDDLEALYSSYKRLKKNADIAATQMSDSYIRVDCYEKKKKIVIITSGREIMNDLYF